MISSSYYLTFVKSYLLCCIGHLNYFSTFSIYLPLSECTNKNQFPSLTRKTFPEGGPAGQTAGELITQSSLSLTIWFVINSGIYGHMWLWICWIAQDLQRNNVARFLLIMNNKWCNNFKQLSQEQHFFLGWTFKSHIAIIVFNIFR